MQSEARINAIIAPNKLWIISKNLNIEERRMDSIVKKCSAFQLVSRLIQRNLEDRGTRVRCCVPGRLTSSTEIFRKRESGCVMAVRIRANVSLKKNN